MVNIFTNDNSSNRNQNQCLLNKKKKAYNFVMTIMVAVIQPELQVPDSFAISDASRGTLLSLKEDEQQFQSSEELTYPNLHGLVQIFFCLRRALLSVQSRKSIRLILAQTPVVRLFDRWNNLVLHRQCVAQSFQQSRFMTDNLLDIILEQLDKMYNWPTLFLLPQRGTEKHHPPIKALNYDVNKLL